MDSHVGSGKIITAPIITEDGKPIKDPLVLLEATSDQHTMQGSSSNSRNENEVDKSENCVVDKQIIEWKLLLHQIGKVHTSIFLFLLCLPLFHCACTYKCS